MQRLARLHSAQAVFCAVAESCKAQTDFTAEIARRKGIRRRQYFVPLTFCSIPPRFSLCSVGANNDFVALQRLSRLRSFIAQAVICTVAESSKAQTNLPRDSVSRRYTAQAVFFCRCEKLQSTDGFYRRDSASGKLQAQTDLPPLTFCGIPPRFSLCSVEANNDFIALQRLSRLHSAQAVFYAVAESYKAQTNLPRDSVSRRYTAQAVFCAVAESCKAQTDFTAEMIARREGI